METTGYRILDVLGQGGFGVVYRAEHVGLSGFVKPVAVKVLHRDLSAVTEFVVRLRDEARILGRLQHRAVVRVDSLVQLDGAWAIVMEYVEGASADEVVRHALMPTSVALEIVEEVASALAFAFAVTGSDGREMQLLHRDIKPSNVQLSVGGDVKLLDFGVARATFGERESQTRAIVLGSVPYLAPERLEFRDCHESDVFALGVTLVELIAGALPGEPTADRQRHEQRVVEGLSRVGLVEPSPQLAALLEKMLSFDAKDRPTAAQVARDVSALRRVLQGETLRDWSAPFLRHIIASRETKPGEWTGRLLSPSGVVGASGPLPDAATPDPSSLLRGLASSLATFDALDDPEAGAAPGGRASEREAPPLPVSHNGPVSAPISFPSAAPAPRRAAAAPNRSAPAPSRSEPEPPRSEPAPRRSERQARKQSFASVRLISAAVGSMLVSSVATVVVIFIGVVALFVVGFGALVVMVWPEAAEEVAIEMLEEYAVKVRDESGRSAAQQALIRDLQNARSGDPSRLGLTGIIGVQLALELALDDGDISEDEATRLHKLLSPALVRVE